MNFLFKNSHKINNPVLIADIISAAVLVLMLYTSITKIIDYGTFRAVLEKSPLLHDFATLIAFVLPVTEILVVLLLFVPRTRLTGLYISLFLLGVFTIYIICMVAFSPDLPCNCGGVLKFLTWTNHIYFNLFFILLSIQGIIFYRKSKIRKSSPPP